MNGYDNLKKHITTKYKGLFGRSEEISVTLDAGRTNNIPQVTAVENGDDDLKNT
jgi:hypothetical protein